MDFGIGTVDTTSSTQRSVGAGLWLLLTATVGARLADRMGVAVVAHRRGERLPEARLRGPQFVPMTQEQYERAVDALAVLIRRYFAARPPSDSWMVGPGLVPVRMIGRGARRPARTGSV
ncbi:hypothetical protein [Cryptosporangium japonicum]|uniref:Uncharacterized protein n=1 Tax=Cryptosporangium japonicum TaxID=80872 RepID=A0ABN0UYA1_9ACTN